MVHFEIYRFQDPPILQGRMHRTELPELGFGLNFLYWGALATHLPGFDDVQGARCRHLAPEFSGAIVIVELNEGAIFEQNTVSKIYLSIKM